MKFFVLFSTLNEKIKSKIYKIAYGTKGILQTVEFLKKLKEKYKKNKKIRLLTMRIIKNIINEYNQAKVIYNWLVKNIKYVGDIVGVETIQSPLITLTFKQGDCDDIALLAACMLESIGIKTRYVITGYKPDKRFTHIYLYVLINKTYYPFDVTTKKSLGYENPKFTIRRVL